MLDFYRRNLPEIARDKDLIRLKIFNSMDACSRARREANCPNYLQVNKKDVTYLKSDVLKFLESKYIKVNNEDTVLSNS